MASHKFNSSHEYIQRMIWTRKLARELMDEHGLNDWRFILSSTKRSVGRCWYADKKIEYSTYYLHNSDEEVKDTILHEIAHALAGNAAGHNYMWKHYARLVGARPERCAPPEVTTSAKPNYVIRCESCGWETKRFRMRRSNHGGMCPECGTVVTIYRITRR